VTALDNLGRGALHLLLSCGPVANVKDRQDQLRDALITALSNGCDPNGPCIDSVMSPSDIAIYSHVNGLDRPKHSIMSGIR
jgi:hypothetical protein